MGYLFTVVETPSSLLKVPNISEFQRCVFYVVCLSMQRMGLRADHTSGDAGVAFIVAVNGGHHLHSLHTLSAVPVFMLFPAENTKR